MVLGAFRTRQALWIMHVTVKGLKNIGGYGSFTKSFPIPMISIRQRTAYSWVYQHLINEELSVNMLNHMSIVIAFFTFAVTFVVLTVIMEVLFYKADAIGNRCPTVWQRSEGLHLCIGSDNNDHIDGSKSPDIIVGLAGDDLLRGGNGNDVLQAGGGDDKLFGNSGDDNIQGGPGLDQLNGDSGNDIIFVALMTIFSHLVTEMMNLWWRWR